MTAPLRRDPTRTTQLRRRFMAAIKRKFVALKRAVMKYFEDNPLGLVANGGGPAWVRVANVEETRFVFATDKARLEAFDKWLQEQIDAGVLVESEYEGFIDTAYKQGVRRAYEETNKAGGIDKSEDFLQGHKEAFLAESFNGPVARGRVEMLATRSFELLKGVTATMATRMNTLLADGITQGRNPRDVARDMARTIDGLTRQRALTIARTEIIHAHAEGQLDSFDKLGVERLDVEIEWVTAGDARVCPKCRAKNGTRYIETSDARGMIPFHPNCRCMWVPAVHVPTDDELEELEKRAEAALAGGAKKKKVLSAADHHRIQKQKEAAIKSLRNDVGGAIAFTFQEDSGAFDLATIDQILVRQGVGRGSDALLKESKERLLALKQGTSQIKLINEKLLTLLRAADKKKLLAKMPKSTLKLLADLKKGVNRKTIKKAALNVEGGAFYGERVDEAVEAAMGKKFRRTTAYHGMPAATDLEGVVVNGVEVLWEHGNPTSKARAMRFIRESLDVEDAVWATNERVVFQSARNKADDYWAKTYGYDNFTSAATGGDGTICVYNNFDMDLETYYHESGHNIAKIKWGQTKPPPGSDFYQVLDVTDEGRVLNATSRYGKNSTAEAFAEITAYHLRGKAIEPDAMPQVPILEKILQELRDAL